jgi:hypothetical protein
MGGTCRAYNAAVVLINRGDEVQLVDLDVLGYLPIGETFQDVLTFGRVHH